jgi:RND family efflux transporter MFP subunit
MNETPTQEKIAPVISTARAKKNNALPFVVGGVAIGLLAFGIGRRSAPTPPPEVTTGTAESGNSAGDAATSGSADKAAPDVIRFDQQSARLAGIAVQPVTLSPLATGIPFNGQIAANPNGVVRVASLVPGRVTRLLVAQGDPVRQGQILAVVESRAIGEAQSAFQSAQSRFQNAGSNLQVVLQQARAGVFARAPIEAARRTQVDAQADVRAQETAVRANTVALDNARRLARSGSFASPALEAARGQSAAALEAVRTAQAALSNAQASVQSASSELARRRQLAASGSYVSRPVEEARRALVAAQSARAAAQSEVATTRVNLARLKTLSGEGLVAQRDVENAQNAFDTATSRLTSAQSDETTAGQELGRQQRLASSNVAGVAEVGAAQSALASAKSDVATRRAELARAREGARLAGFALARERSVFGQSIANRREISTAQSALENAQTALTKARQTLGVANATFAREQRILSQNLNNISQVQTARSAYAAAQSELQAARTALALFKSSPGGSASVPVRAPIAGVVQTRDVAQGETVAADAALLTLVNLDSVAVEAAIYEKDFRSVRVGAPVSASVDAFPGRRFEGRITFLGSQLDPATRTLTARALLRNPGDLRPGMFARGSISTESGRFVASVPGDAVQTMDGQAVVFVPTGKAFEFKARPVKTGATAGGRIEIKSGLRPGEKVVTRGAFVVKSQALKGALTEE